jgi:hypothetical protein
VAREAKLLGFVLLLAAIFAEAQASLAAPDPHVAARARVTRSGGREECGGGRPGDRHDHGGLGSLHLAAPGEREDRGDGGDQGDASGDAHAHGHCVDEGAVRGGHQLAAGHAPGLLAGRISGGDRAGGDVDDQAGRVPRDERMGEMGPAAREPG